jgi:hypothetical protein
MLVTRSGSPLLLRENQTVRLVLPRDLRSAEATQLFAFMPTVTPG